MTEHSIEELARNQMLFRALNQKLDGILERSGEPPSYVCECSRPECVERIALAHAEYAEVRSHSARFAISPGHDFPQVEQVVRENGRFVIVEKFGRAAEIANGVGAARAVRPGKGQGGA